MAASNERYQSRTEVLQGTLRGTWGWRWLMDLFQDSRYAFRTFRQRPAFVFVALLTLGLGIGATTVMFTVVNGVLLKPLPYPQPEKLVTVREYTEGEKDPRFGGFWAFSYPNFLDCQNASRSLDVAAWRYNGGTVSAHGQAEYVDGLQVSSNFFSALGVPLLRGHSFQPGDDRTGAGPVVVISHGLWQRLYDGHPNAVGQSLMLDGKAYTVVGVAPPDFRFGGEQWGVYTPLGQDTSEAMQNRKIHPGISAFARLRPDVKLAKAQTELKLIARHLEEQYPDSNNGRTFVAEPLRPDVGDVQSTLWLLLGAVGLVLLIACANVASLLLARAVSRERELAMRVALGARRNRLVRQCLTESAVLGLSGGLLGVMLAALGISPFAAFWPGTLPRVEEVQIDWRVLLFAVGVSLLSGLVFGLAPALRAPARDVEQILRSGARSVTSSSRRLHGAFVVSEIALAMVLLVAAGMLGRTLLRLSTLDPGVDARNLLIARMALSSGTLANRSAIRATWQDVLERARRVPGVQAVATVDTVPMREGNNQLGYWASRDVPAKSERPIALATSVTPDYLKVMGIPLRQGRFFDEHDRLGGEPVIVIDDVLAQHAFGGQDPVGKPLWIPEMGDGPFKVVGVVGHVRHWGLAGDDQAQVRAQFYYPFAQVPDSLLRRWSELMSVAVRTSVPPLSVVEPLRKDLRAAAGDQVLYEIHTMEQLTNDSLGRQRFLLLLFGVFASLALLLACIGIYGVLAYLTGQRVPELGVRMALGASARDVLWIVLRQSLGMILIGVAVGTLAALAAGPVLQRMVVGMQPTSGTTFAVTTPLLVSAAVLASFLPARQASRVDPLVALKYE